MMELHLKLAGALLVVLAGIHIGFPRYFRWKEELVPLSLVNRQMMYVHMFFIALMLMLMGMLCFWCSHDLLHTALGRKIALGMSSFWMARLIFQFFVYSPQLWRGKAFETSVHIVFSCLWLYLSVLFWVVYSS